jgi:hypothetical protein
LFSVPCYNLQSCARGPHASRLEVQAGYLSVLGLATARPDSKDRPGAIVSDARRLRASTRIAQNQASSGF